MQQRTRVLALGLVVTVVGACGSAPTSGGEGYRITAFVSPSGAGTVAFVPEQPTYDAGERVLLRAQPSTGKSFVRYSGGVSSTVAETTVVVNGDLELTAQFADTVETAPPGDATLEMVNDLPGGKDADGDWSRLNTLVRVRVDGKDLLTSGESSCEPETIATGRSRTFDVHDAAPDYDVDVQTGSWEYDPFFSGCWDLYFTAVHDCGGGCCASKAASTRVTEHTGGTRTLRLSTLLPPRTWEGSELCK